MAWTAALKIAYDGRDFNGSQRQPDMRTVEGEVLRALKRIKAISSVTESRFRTASRTDAGVSALGNVVCFDTDFEPDRLLHALNAVSEDVHYYGLVKVPSDFTPRRAKQRWYRYYLSGDDIDLDRFVACARLFEGRHDFQRFCKPEGKATVKTVEKVAVQWVGDIIVIDLYAREFLRNMVRRMIAAMTEVGRGRVALDEVMKALNGREKSFGLAKAEGLVLMDVLYPIDVPVMVSASFRRKVKRRRERAMQELLFYDRLTEVDNDIGP